MTSLAYALWRLGDRLRLPVSSTPPLPRGTAPILRDDSNVYRPGARSVDRDVLALLEWQMIGLQSAPGSEGDKATRFHRGRALAQLTLEQRRHAHLVARGVLALLEHP